MKELKVYVAGALSSKEDTGRNPSKVVVDYIQNLHKMCQAASKVRRLGHYPYIPGLIFLMGAVVGDWTDEEYRDMGMAFLEVCDVVFVSSPSWGVDQEIMRAKELQIPVIYDLLYLGEEEQDSSIRV